MAVPSQACRQFRTPSCDIRTVTVLPRSAMPHSRCSSKSFRQSFFLVARRTPCASSRRRGAETNGCRPRRRAGRAGRIAPQCATWIGQFTIQYWTRWFFCSLFAPLVSDIGQYLKPNNRYRPNQWTTNQDCGILPSFPQPLRWPPAESFVHPFPQYTASPPLPYFRFHKVAQI